MGYQGTPAKRERNIEMAAQKMTRGVVFPSFRVGIAGLPTHDRDDEEFSLQRRVAGVGCCRDSTAKSETLVNTRRWPLVSFQYITWPGNSPRLQVSSQPIN